MQTFAIYTILVFCFLTSGCTGWAYRVPTRNMIPTIQIGDNCIVNKYEYVSDPIQRFDIVVFNAPEWAKRNTNQEGDIKFLKRVIGLPNEKIEIRDNKIFINDKLLEEPFEKITDEKDTKKWFSAMTIPENEYFLLGDNRPESLDSRYWKPATIKKSEILGKVVQIIPAKEK